MEEEIWANIAGYEGRYAVSDKGNIASLNYNKTGKPKLLKQKINKYGFCEVKLSKNNKTKNFMVARLVAEAFIPNPLFKDVVIHKNKNKLDNSVKNLKWAYYSEEKHNTYNKGSRKFKGTKTKITYEGKNYKKYSDIALDKGIKLKTFYNRLYNLNWNLYESLEIPVGDRGENIEK